ncbi:MAG: fatty acid desaturase [Candidatus Methylomirabilis sp.]|nr:fatty acid desaturase [Deltaproteobacteria bacterium]
MVQAQDIGHDEPKGVDDPLYDRRDLSDKELLKVLRELRRRLLRRPEVAKAVRELTRPIGSRDFYVSLGCLVGGAAGQAFAVTYAPFLIPAFLFVQLMGLAGVHSLAHESWHRRSHPNERVDRAISRCFVGPVMLGSNEAHRADHVLHHKMPGEPQDPSSVIWELTDDEFMGRIRERLLILPAIVRIVRLWTTGASAVRRGDQAGHRMDAATLGPVVVVHALWALPLLAASVPAFLVGYVLPLPLGSIFAQLREYREHARFPDGRTAVYDILCNEFERVLVPGGYFNLHALHHAFPEIPQRRLPELYRVLERSVDMEKEYYGLSPQIGLKRSYFKHHPLPV